jgi:hypothetical protein
VIGASLLRRLELERACDGSGDGLGRFVFDESSNKKLVRIA